HVSSLVNASALRATWESTCARVQPGQRLGSPSAESSNEAAVAFSRSVAAVTGPAARVPSESSGIGSALSEGTNPKLVVFVRQGDSVAVNRAPGTTIGATLSVPAPTMPTVTSFPAHHRSDRSPRGLMTERTAIPAGDRLVVRGDREHNLKDVSLDLPRDSLIVFTGLSGSGKSSLAFDTIFAEGQRRYVESLSAYARQFLGQMDKPDVDFIEGLSPAVSIDQKSTSRNPRSTVGTITEVYDYLRLLYARAGHPHCPECGRPIGRQTPQSIVDQVLELEEGA